MRHFFIIVFGGLAIVLGSIAISWTAGRTWQALRSPDMQASIQASVSRLLALAHDIFPQSIDGTSILGITRVIRYTADEEEGPPVGMNFLAQSDDGPITASAYIVRNITRDQVVSDNNGTKLLPIASLTKLVTAAVARKIIAPSEHITITPEIMRTYGNTAVFRPGEIFRAEDLLYPLLMVSSNDAAEALARDYGRREFIQAMNDFAQSIGAYRTYFADPSGLSPNNESTVSDLAIILEWIHANDPAIMEITKLSSKTVRNHTWNNPTHFLSWSNYAGGKNGYIPESDRTSAALFTLGSKKDLYAVVVLGSSSRDADVAKLLGKVK